jgi:hypothetical protein
MHPQINEGSEGPKSDAQTDVLPVAPLSYCPGLTELGLGTQLTNGAVCLR